ncbi:MAG: hypothetical protein HOF69_00060 [Campylobacteraceae bacterium]|nr:hypothetical protein [Campylobacteraceae bacterium]MBT3881637.1 hypothetical protein [Campylobacteraceae bacterium]MBT4572586.1 hypothetical protein [Campylobacteraceae bacterium]MBT4708049.1 hypothetical protein [Campylobacteraceae bacterium]MBT5324147.1 hypothetical protein [Campylobacteraceae bacterium]
MIKLVPILLLSMISLFGISNNEYYIQYKGITLGKISDFSTIDKGYLIGKPVGGILGAFITFDNYIIHEAGKKPKIKGDNKEKKDKYLLLSLIRKIQKEQPKHTVFKKDNYEITIECKNSKCTYSRLNTKKQKTYTGYMNFKNNILDVMCDDESHICFKQVQ